MEMDSCMGLAQLISSWSISLSLPHINTPHVTQLCMRYKDELNGDGSIRTHIDFVLFTSKG